MSLSKASLTASERKVLEDAACWYARLCSDQANAKDHRDWSAWHEADPAHRVAWGRIEAMQQRMQAVPSVLAIPAFKAADKAEAGVRRTVLRSVLVLAGVGSLSWLGWQQPVRQQWMADLRTGTGERGEITLPDGSQLSLNTRTSVDVAYDNTQRLLKLRTGEILIETARDAMENGASRPFLVETIHGRILALGTRFLVHSNETYTRVTVLDKAVEVRPAAGGDVVRLEAGHRIDVGASGFVGDTSSAIMGADAWRRGSLIADNMPLAKFLQELGRYRSGLIACDPVIANLKISGAFPIDNTDRALQVLINGFPLRVEFRTRYWVRVLPA